MSDNPKHPAQRLLNAPRCHAKAKTTGQTCKAPAVNGWTVCRMHGAKGGAPRGKGNGKWRHGGRSLDLTETRRLMMQLARMARDGLDDLDD